MEQAPQQKNKFDISPNTLIMAMIVLFLIITSILLYLYFTRNELLSNLGMFAYIFKNQ